MFKLTDQQLRHVPLESLFRLREEVQGMFPPFPSGATHLPAKYRDELIRRYRERTVVLNEYLNQIQDAIRWQLDQIIKQETPNQPTPETQ